MPIAGLGRNRRNLEVFDHLERLSLDGCRSDAWLIGCFDLVVVRQKSTAFGLDFDVSKVELAKEPIHAIDLQTARVFDGMSVLSRPYDRLRSGQSCPNVLLPLGKQ